MCRHSLEQTLWVPRAVLGYKMCRWMHSLRCFWEMGPWLCVCSLHRGNCQQSQEKKQKTGVRGLWYTTQTFYMRNVSCLRVMDWNVWLKFKAAEVFVSQQEAALVSCVLSSITISIFFCSVCIRLLRQLTDADAVRVPVSLCECSISALR